MTPAFAYLRVSSRGQAAPDADGFPRQRDAIARHAAANNIEIVATFEERGVCGGTEWEERPAWMDLVASLNGVRTIVIERLDRLARDLGVQEWILRELRKRDITLVSTAEPDLGGADPTRVLFRQIMGAIAQFDRAMIEAKLRAARVRQRTRDGRCEGRKPFGSRPGESEVLEKIREFSTYQFSAKRIAAWLNLKNIATRRGGEWHPATVAKIVRRLQSGVRS